MKLIIGEAYSTDDYCFPILEIELNNINELPNIKYLNDRKMEIEIEVIEFPYIINFTQGFFDSLSTATLDTLTEVYSLFDYDYISSKMWVCYIVSSEIELPPIKKINRAFNIFSNSKNINEKLKIVKKKFPHLNRSTNKISKTIFFPYDVDIYRYHNMLRGYQTGFVLMNEVIVKNELELLYSFMDFIFNSNYNYYIKKCEKCNKFYISNKSDTKYCNRINTNNLTCKQLTAKSQIKNASSTERSRIDKRYREYFNRQSDDTYKQFLKDFKIFKKNNYSYTDNDLLTFLEDYKQNYLSLIKL